MRSTGFLLLLGCAVAACSNDSTAVVYVSLSYQVRCLDCSPRVPDDTPHEIMHVDGEAGYQLSCSVKRSGSTRLVSFDVVNTSGSNNQRFRVTSGVLDAPDTSGNCDATIVEGSNTYEGGCGSDPPSDTGAPCQATFTSSGGVIRGGMYCSNIKSPSDNSIMRYIVKPGTMSDPAPFEIHGCSGL